MAIDPQQRKSAESTRQEALDDSVRIFGRSVRKSDLFKFLGLIGFFVICVVAVIFMYPLFKDIFEPGGVDIVIDRIRDKGAFGVLILLALQFIQVVVAFIPGEVTQMAAGMLYGPFWGALIILFGCAISSAFVYTLVHKLGAPFVKDLVPEKHLKKFQDFEKTGRLGIIVFILFLIPGLPKDTFTYLVPLTDMKLKPFVLITTIARSPGVILSAYAADGLIEGNIWTSVIIFAVLIVLAVLALIFSNKIMAFLSRYRKK
ncbi:TVP38/TMEM64 family protein [Anaerotardibacter muris]|uniref:TVP38/TMEM64 family protein n=1 Tax=Anaerotardibacter muris TaxID=2941505 RepID=UPI00203EBA6B|nr:VTT domain-containing protein [Anaerotardibacter muris]